MSLIRYQTPETVAWPTLGRWTNLRDELDSLFELPFLANIANQTQLFSGWTPALELYQSNDNVVAGAELPRMHKEVMEISRNEGMLTISGERKNQAAEREEAERSERSAVKFRRSISLPA